MAETKTQKAENAKKATSAKARKKKRLSDVNGCAHIHSTVNNTIVTLTDTKGNCIS